MPHSSPPRPTAPPVRPHPPHRLLSPGRLVAEVAAAPALAAPGPLFVGVSGGGDSLALLHLLAAAAPERDIIAAIVDHGLRPESADEAARAADMARDIGAEPAILRLDWPDGERRSQDAARQARHRALARLAETHGARVLCLGHTRDDQAETVLMRRDAGSGARGLAGMAALSPSPVWPEGRDLWIARPVLGVSREALRTHLREAGLGWIEDPSNAMVKFARVRARAHLRDSGETDRLVEIAARHGEVAAAEDREALDAVVQNVRFGEGDAVAGPGLLAASGAARALAARALAALALGVGGGAREPGPAAAARLLDRLGGGRSATLGGARFLAAGRAAGGKIRVTRDPGGVHGRRGGGRRLAALPLPDGETVVWDNRLALRAGQAGWSAEAADRRVTEPVFVHAGQAADPGEAVACRWLVEDRVRLLLWRAAGPGFC